MNRYNLRIVLLVTCFILFLPNSSKTATPDIDHSYFQSEEYKKSSEDIRRKEAELRELSAKLTDLQNDRKQFTWDSMTLFLQSLDFLPFFSLNTLIIIPLLSLIFIAIYFFYLKIYNPAKWFIFFESSKNLQFLLKKIRWYNSLILLFCLAVLFSPSIGLAGTDTLTDAKYFFFGNEMEREYITVKYPKSGRTLPNATVNGIKIYQKFEDGSFEQQYDLIVYEFALGMPPKAPDVLRLIERVRSVENLQATYAFVFRLDTATMKEVVQKRLAALPKLRSDAKYVEIEIIIAKSKDTNYQSLLAEDIAVAVNQMIPDSPGTGGSLRIASLLVDVDPAKASEVFDRVKYRFKEIIGNKDNESWFKSVYDSLSKTRPGIYKQDDSFQLGDQPQGLKILAAALFDNTDDRIASTIVRELSIDRSTHLNQKEYEILIDLWKKYRKEEIPAFFDMLAATYIKHDMSNIAVFMSLASHLGYENDAAMDKLIKQDSDYHGLRSDQSTLITKEFMSLLNSEVLGKNFEYFKTRTAQAKIILDALFQKREDLFLDYLRCCYEKEPRLVADLEYGNKLAGFSKWKGLVSDHSIENFRVPASYYLAVKEFSGQTPNAERAKGLIRQNADDRLRSIIMSENNLKDMDFLDELMLYYVYSASSDPQAVAMKSVLENSISLQTKARVAQIVSALDSKIARARGQVQSLSSELSTMKGQKLWIQVRVWIASVLIFIIGLYMLAALLLSVKYTINCVAAYSGTRVGLFATVFLETFAKFLVPVLYCTSRALAVVAAVQLYGFLKSRDGEYPNVQRSLTNYLEGQVKAETTALKG